jgi:hypothetical protein
VNTAAIADIIQDQAWHSPVIIQFNEYICKIMNGNIMKISNSMIYGFEPLFLLGSLDGIKTFINISINIIKLQTIRIIA